MAQGRISDPAGEMAARKITSDEWMNRGAPRTTKPTTLFDRPRHAFAGGRYFSSTGKGPYSTLFHFSPFFSGVVVVGLRADL